MFTFNQGVLEKKHCYVCHVVSEPASIATHLHHIHWNQQNSSWKDVAKQPQCFEISLGADPEEHHAKA